MLDKSSMALTLRQDFTAALRKVALTRIGSAMVYDMVEVAQEWLLACALEPPASVSLADANGFNAGNGKSIASKAEARARAGAGADAEAEEEEEEGQEEEGEEEPPTILLGSDGFNDLESDEEEEAVQAAAEEAAEVDARLGPYWSGTRTTATETAGRVRKGGVWNYVVGLVGKPSAGKRPVPRSNLSLSLLPTPQASGAL